MTQSASPILELRGLHGGWGQTTVVEDLDLSVHPGETVAILGRNGVGKSTLLELIVGRAQRQSGSIRLCSTEISALPIHSRSASGLGFVPQEREVFKSLTVDEHLAIAKRPGRWTTDKVLELFPFLAQRRRAFGDQLSGGEQQMLAIARALVGNPLMLLMDEPSEGLAPIVVEHLVTALRQVIESQSLAVLLVEQRTDIALDMAERCLIMERGRIVHEAASMALKNADDLAQRMGLQR